MKKLENRTALITGCNRGVGKAIMLAFMREGANIVACTRKKNEETLNLYAEYENEFGIKIYPIYFDLANEEELKSVVNQCLKNNKIDILINNAAMPHMGLLQMTSIQKFKEVFQINFFSLALLSQIISKQMIKRKTGVIINIGSMAGLENFAGYTAYGASKAAVIHFTRTLARELAPFNIRVNSVSPGLLEDGMGSLQHDKSADEIIERTDLKRRGKAIDIAETILFLSSNKAEYITGQNIRIDGGM